MAKFASVFEEELTRTTNGARLLAVREKLGYQRFRAICRNPGAAQLYELETLAETMDRPPFQVLELYGLGGDRLTWNQSQELKAKMNEPKTQKNETTTENA